MAKSEVSTATFNRLLGSYHMCVPARPRKGTQRTQDDPLGYSRLVRKLARFDCRPHLADMFFKIHGCKSLPTIQKLSLFKTAFPEPKS